MTAGLPGEPGVQQARPAAPDDAQRLQAEIERTREQLGETVEQLAAKADMKSRARAKAAALAGRVKNTTRQKAVSARQAGMSQLQRRAAPVWEATPEPARQAVAQGASAVRRHRGLLAAAGVLMILGFVAVRQRRK